MPDNVASAESNPRFFWPWFLPGFFLSPATTLLSRWTPTYVAAGASFFLLFTVASLLVVRLLRSRDVSYVRLIAASATGGVICGAFRYIWP